MADVRLTATNPDDSSVVHVACNEKGELKLEEPIVVEGPPGAPGEQGPPGQDGQDGAPGQDGQDGDPFSGNFTGDVYFDGKVGIGTTDLDAKLHVDKGHVVIGQKSGGNTGMRNYIKFGRANNPKAAIGFVNNESNGRGSLIFMNDSDSNSIEFTDADECMRITHYGYVGVGVMSPKTKFSVHNLAGFTEEGHLWCTTRRGETVILDFISNGMAVWESYTPPSRNQEDLMELADEIRDQLEADPSTDIDSLRLTED